MLLKAVHQIEANEQRVQLNLLIGSQLSEPKAFKEFLQDHFGEE